MAYEHWCILGLTDDEINGQAFVFFLAGYETTASTLRFASYVLSTHPDLDTKLYDEITEQLGEVWYSVQYILNYQG